MAQTRTLQRRIRSVKNAKQITKALEVVAASRMRRVVALVEGSKTYGEMAAAIMQRVAANPEAKTKPFFSLNPDKPPLFIAITSDRGQAGAYNSNIYHQVMEATRTSGRRPQLIIFGRKGGRHLARFETFDIKGAYQDIADVPEVNVFGPVIETIIEGVENGEFSQVVIFYTQFISSLTQKAVALPLLPLEQVQSEADQPADNKVFEFEPDISDVLDEAIRLYLEARLMQTRIESAASEHAMRMVAMGNANRNATDLIDNLTLELNATRQAAITQEIAEITGGAAAIAA
jgi:F-type H+-transporting ATPase subunit gamma